MRVHVLPLPQVYAFLGIFLCFSFFLFIGFFVLFYSCFSLLYICLFFFFLKRKRGVFWSRKGKGSGRRWEKMGGDEGAETMIRLYCMKIYLLSINFFFRK